MWPTYGWVDKTRRQDLTAISLLQCSFRNLSQKFWLGIEFKTFVAAQCFWLFLFFVWFIGGVDLWDYHFRILNKVFLFWYKIFSVAVLIVIGYCVNILRLKCILIGISLKIIDSGNKTNKQTVPQIKANCMD